MARGHQRCRHRNESPGPPRHSLPARPLPVRTAAARARARRAARVFIAPSHATHRPPPATPERATSNRDNARMIIARVLELAPSAAPADLHRERYEPHECLLRARPPPPRALASSDTRLPVRRICCTWNLLLKRRGWDCTGCWPSCRSVCSSIYLQRGTLVVRPASAARGARVTRLLSECCASASRRAAVQCPPRYRLLRRVP